MRWPLWTDPLAWGGLVLGIVGAVWAVLARDLSGWNAAFAASGNLLASLFVVSFVGGAIREFVRLRRISGENERGGAPG
jgi:hypothetical protein